MAIKQNYPMNINKTISVLMTVYNGMPYLIEAVESTLNQTYKNFKFFLISTNTK